MRFSGEARIDPTPQRDVVWPAALISMVIGIFAVFVYLPASATIQLLSAAAVALIALTTAWRLTPGSPRRLAPRPLAADERGVFVDGALFVAARQIRSATVATPDRLTVTIDLPRGRQHAIAFDREEDADAFVDALGLDSSHRATRVRALPPWSRHLRPLGLFLTTSPWVLINLLRFLPTYAIGLVLALYGLLALPLVLPQKVEIGHDGVLFSWLKKRRFIAYREIKDVETTRYGVLLHLDDGREAEIRISQKENAARWKAEEIASTIREGLLLRAEHGRIEQESLLARGTRTVEEWVRDMRALGTSEAAAYRTLSIPRERLWDVLENPTAEASAREGAALALHPSLDDVERGRLAGIAARSAAPRLRVALEAMAEAQDEQHVRVAVEDAELLDDQAPLSTRSRLTP